MPKKSSGVSSQTGMDYQRLLLIVSGILLLGLLVVVWKYRVLKANWQSHAEQTLESMTKHRTADSAEDAAVLALTVGLTPEAAPLMKQPAQLTAFVAKFSDMTKRDLVIVDANKMILADTVPSNVGKKFAEDKENEVGKTIADGQTRSFTEESTDYPKGILQTVVPLKTSAGKIEGAVILSSSTIFN